MENKNNTMKKLLKIQEGCTKAKEEFSKNADSPENREKLMNTNSEVLDFVVNGFNVKMTDVIYTCPFTQEKRSIELRLLSSKEGLDITMEVEKAMKEVDTFNKDFQILNIYWRTLVMAAKPSPFCTDVNDKSRGGLTLETVQCMTVEDVEYIYMQYMDWVRSLSKSPYELTNEEIELIYDEIKKNPTLLSQIERRQLVPVMIYNLEYIRILEEKIEYLETKLQE